ncbi:MAG: leucyl/phenylalanyl-tRNA--protein transferase [Burkholderiales bacterium]|nr:leucyl/phenylalanyl-tRNA--protein transferase [Burkholderiales bacterium]
MIPWLGREHAFPPLGSALDEPNGLLAAGGDLSPGRIIAAYRRGIFPWFGDDEPILWWSPDPRMVLYPEELRVSRSLRKAMRRPDYEIRVDTQFRAVMEGCARPRPGQAGTWIGASMIKAYCALHERGFAHSVETWREGELVGGLYGVALGRAFFGESMFARAADASKLALAHLARQLERWRFGVIDCQMRTNHMASLGAREITRAQFSRLLEQLVNYPPEPAVWAFDRDLAG